MKTYAEKLKDPRWQQMRLKVMERDGFACQRCGAKDKTLNVHHLIYEKGAQPWEGNPWNLITLCEDCHQIAEDKVALCDFRRFMASGVDLATLRGVAKKLSDYAIGKQATGESFEAEDSTDILINAVKQGIWDEAHEEGRQLQFRIERRKQVS